MKRYIRRLLHEGLLSENKIYPRKVLEVVLRKLGDSSDETLNKLAISGLYRGVFGDISRLSSKEELDTAFDLWHTDMIKNMVKTPSFIDNTDLATKYLDAYVNNIKSLELAAQPFSIKNIERTLVDLVNHNQWVEEKSMNVGTDIYNPKEEDISYEDEEVVILDTNTKAKCVMYGKGETWCITYPELNYYNTYRIQYGATPYFVLQKNVEGAEHKVVIMNYGEAGYAIADRSNTGSRSGDSSNAGDWAGIVRGLPNLSDLEQYFPYRVVTEEEKLYEKLLNDVRYYTGDDLQEYINKVIDGVVINGSQVTSHDFIRDVALNDDFSINERQLDGLEDDSIDSLIEVGYFTMNPSYNGLNPRQLRRNIKLKRENGIMLSFPEFNTLDDEDKREYLKKQPYDILRGMFQHQQKKENLYIFKTLYPYLKDRLNYEEPTPPPPGVQLYSPPKNVIYFILENMPDDSLEVIKILLPHMINDGELEEEEVKSLLGNGHERYLEILRLILPYIKGMMSPAMVRNIMSTLPLYSPNPSLETIKMILPYIDFDGMNGEPIIYNILRHITGNESRMLEIINLLFPYIININIDGGVVESLLVKLSSNDRYEMIKRLIPYIKNYSDGGVIIKEILDYTPQENKLEIINMIIPYLKDGIDVYTFMTILGGTPEGKRLEMITRLSPMLELGVINYDWLHYLLPIILDEQRLQVLKILLPYHDKGLDYKELNSLTGKIPNKDKSEFKGLVQKHIDGKLQEHKKLIKNILRG